MSPSLESGPLTPPLCPQHRAVGLMGGGRANRASRRGVQSQASPLTAVAAARPARAVLTSGAFAERAGARARRAEAAASRAVASRASLGQAQTGGLLRQLCQTRLLPRSGLAPSGGAPRAGAQRAARVPKVAIQAPGGAARAPRVAAPSRGSLGGPGLLILPSATPHRPLLLNHASMSAVRPKISELVAARMKWARSIPVL